MLRRISMYGGEPALLVHLDAVAFVDGHDRFGVAEAADRMPRGAVTSTGVAGLRPEQQSSHLGLPSPSAPLDAALLAVVEAHDAGLVMA